MNGARTRGRALWIAALLAVVAFAATRLEVTHSLEHFLPSGEDAELVSLSREVASSDLTRTTVLSISLPDAPPGREPTLVRASSRLERELAQLPGVAEVVGGVAEDELAEIYDLYFPRRVYLVSEAPTEEIPALLSREALAASAEGLRARLAGPGSAGASRLAPEDPLDLFGRVTERLAGSRPDLEVREGRFLTPDGRHALLFVEGRHSPFDSTHQGPLQAGITAAVARVAAELGEPVLVEQAGVGRLALATETTIRADLRRIGTISVVGVGALFLLLFGSLRIGVLALVPAVAGVAFACSATLLAAGEVHGITLAFGASLVGVAVDYSIHLINHASLLPAGADAARRLRPSLLLGGATTLAGFAGFALTSFPGVRQMGLFAVAGVAAALVVTLFGLPLFLPAEARPTAAQRATARALGRWLGWLRGHRAVLFGLVAGALVLAASGTWRIQWRDDPTLLTQQDPALLAEDARVRARASRVENGRFVIAVADDPETALARNDEVWRRLRTAVEAGAAEGVHSLHAFVWSEALQRENLAALRSVPQLARRVDEAFSSAGFTPGAFGAFARTVAEPAAPPLRPSDLRGGSLSRVLDSTWLDLDGRSAAVTSFRGVRDLEALRAAVADLPGVHFFDERSLLTELYERYRRKTVELIGAGCAAVLALLWLRYRRWRPSLAAFAPCALAMGGVLGLFGLLGTPLNLIGTASLILILGIGVDYGIFVVDSARTPEHLGATMLSLLASGLTTLFVFGVLALSPQPALRAIGLTTGVGVALAFVLAPAALLLVEGSPRGAASGGTPRGDGSDSPRRVG